eukprot:jgi/Mesvir1/3924/Mv19864-RA.1
MAAECTKDEVRQSLGELSTLSEKIFSTFLDPNGESRTGDLVRQYGEKREVVDAALSALHRRSQQFERVQRVEAAVAGNAVALRRFATKLREVEAALQATLNDHPAPLLTPAPDARVATPHGAAAATPTMSDIVWYAHRISYGSFGPPSADVATEAPQRSQPPAPQEEHMRSSALYHYSGPDLAALVPPKKAALSSAQKSLKRSRAAESASGAMAGAATSDVEPPASLVDGPAATSAGVPLATPAGAPFLPGLPPGLGAIPAMPKGWKPGDPLPALPPMPPGWRPGDPLPLPPPMPLGWKPGDPITVTLPLPAVTAANGGAAPATPAAPAGGKVPPAAETERAIRPAPPKTVQPIAVPFVQLDLNPDSDDGGMDDGSASDSYDSYDDADD